ncbi:hypothetical protein GY21_13335 [Cryobacterium roopkundense]|uniref:DUF2087 domain-containing protein n=1 Tax=Cryobacterium roopkundense TaxID=1001240 RepID=A0A099J359_9MICO|nr:DUF2087 domain-containing protein [Cryobacterium roopkundense]KGJ72741.1 hypothetical protein GY21_13335 [Cryobacterium roopkundense]MBB5642992.1 hypothetical protein [Cryobacterium roopkundense]
MSDDWRRVIASLLNDDTRTAYAEVVIASAGDSGMVPKRRDRSLARLEHAGLIRRAASGEFVAETSGLRALLETAPVRPERTGIERFLGADGRVDQYPANQEQRAALLRWIAARAFVAGGHLTEVEVNATLEAYAHDVATLRRYLVDAGVLGRDPEGRRYSLRV